MNNPFQILRGSPLEESKQNKNLDLNSRLKNLVSASPIMLFMKGTPDMPQCGFSANVVRILNSLNVSFSTFNILADSDVREGLKQFSNWPTYPQLYVKGQLIGGNDIITEMLQNGELEQVLKM